MTTHTPFVEGMRSNFMADLRARSRRDRTTAKSPKLCTRESTRPTIDTLNESREAAHAALMNRIPRGLPNTPTEKLVRSRAIISIELATASEVDRYRFVGHLERMKLVILEDKTDQHSQRLTVGSKWTDSQFADQLSELVEIAAQLGISATACSILEPDQD